MASIDQESSGHGLPRADPLPTTPALRQIIEEVDEVSETAFVGVVDRGRRRQVAQLQLNFGSPWRVLLGQEAHSQQFTRATDLHDVHAPIMTERQRQQRLDQ